MNDIWAAILLRATSCTRARLCSVSRKFNELCIRASMTHSQWPELYWDHELSRLMVALRHKLGTRIVEAREYHLIARTCVPLTPIEAALTCDEDIMSLVPPVDEEHARDLVISAVNTCNVTVCEKYKDSKHVDVDIRISGRPDIIRLASPDPLADFLLGTLQGKYNGANDLLQGQVTPESFAMCHLACRRDDKKLMKIVSNHIGPLSDPWMNVALSSRSMKVAKYLLIYPTTEVWEIAAASNFIDFLEYIRTIAPIPALPMGLSCAAFSGDAKAVQYMFDRGARDLNEALCVACRHYYSDVMDLLMQLGADDCANCKNSLHWLCRND